MTNGVLCNTGYSHDHLITAISHQQVSCLCLLDLSAAFDHVDTINHSILLHRLSFWFGITDTTLTWLKSNLSSCSFSVLASNFTFTPPPSPFLWRTSGLCPRPYPFQHGHNTFQLSHLIPVIKSSPLC